MKRIVFETANSIGHYDLPDGYNVAELRVNKEEPLLPAFLQDNTKMNPVPEPAHGSTADILLPTEYSNYTPKGALHGHDSESNVLLPTFMNAGQLDAHEGQHGKNNQNRR